MTVQAEQIHIQLKKFQAALTTMAWGIAEEIFEEQRKRLVSGFIDKNPPKLLRAITFLGNKKGTWDRGGGPYKVIGPGEEPETFYLENVTTGKKINATLKTLAFRWKHIP